MISEQRETEEEELWQKVGRRFQGMDRQNGKWGGQGARGGEQVTTEKGRDGEEGDGYSLNLPGRHYLSPLQKSPKKIF